MTCLKKIKSLLRFIRGSSRKPEHERKRRKGVEVAPNGISFKKGTKRSLRTVSGSKLKHSSLRWKYHTKDSNDQYTTKLHGSYIHKKHEIDLLRQLYDLTLKVVDEGSTRDGPSAVGAPSGSCKNSTVHSLRFRH